MPREAMRGVVLSDASSSSPGPRNPAADDAAACAHTCCQTLDGAALISQLDCPPSPLAGALLGGGRCSAIAAGGRLERRMFRCGMPGKAGDRLPSRSVWTM